MNAYCTKCSVRTEHRRTQFGSWFRFYCVTCGNELGDNAARLEAMRKPTPTQSQTDAEAAALLNSRRSQ